MHWNFKPDDLRLADLLRQDTTADTPDQAQQLAADMAQRYGCRVHVLGVIGTVECPAVEEYRIYDDPLARLRSEAEQRARGHIKLMSPWGACA